MVVINRHETADINLSVKDTYLVTFHHVLKFPIPSILIHQTPLQIHQPNAQYIYNTYLYHALPTCFGVPHTIFRENLRIPYPEAIPLQT